ncbi:class I SAM-dependent methyltransferase [uncultured Alcanivorax sp.]|uniref:class I SAM-dependent methyltransferase n=1 Tax=uncultured Alcanivorax sp. TaxID=191215 RepID=UPI0026190010|nr:methyltransferase domain-containing protein [uncultured Alcanivorax sp.]
MDIQSVKSSYARWAPIYDRTFGAVTRSGRRRAVDYINRKGGPKVLEVGVGTGLSLQRYAPHLEVWGIDFSHEMLAKAKRKVSEQALTHVAGLQQMDARELDFPDASFDTVAAMHIVSVVPEPERVLAEMARVCKPGGEIVITNHFASEDGVMARIEKLTAPFAASNTKRSEPAARNYPASTRVPSLPPSIRFSSAPFLFISNTRSGME